jgi:RHS repeat-associated protein
VYNLILVDATGQRVLRHGQSDTIYSSPFFEYNNASTGTKHIFAGQMRVASVLAPFTSGADQAAPTKKGTAFYLHENHLGSLGVVTTEDGSVNDAHEYFPDGAAWVDSGKSSTVDGILFNGKPYDRDTGFYDFGQRFYDPRTSQWLGVDPKIKAMPMSFVGRPGLVALSFAEGNPVRFFDLDGQDKDKPIFTIVNVNNALTKAEMKQIKSETQKALGETTRDALLKPGGSDWPLSGGVEVNVVSGLGKIDTFKKRGDIIVYIVDARDSKARETAVRNILKAEKWDKNPHSKTESLKDATTRLSSHLAQVNLHDPLTGLAVVNIDDQPRARDRSAANTRAIGQTAQHEGLGHRAGLGDVFDKTYDGVMSGKAPTTVTEDQLIFKPGEERAKVNTFLQGTVDDPSWDLH